ncbi:ribosome biogenesis GTPase YlqF, partial [Clostridioides difficile]
KSDMADRDKLNQWIEYYKKINIKAIPVDTIKGVGINKIIEECKNVTREKMSSLKDKGRKERAIRIMIVGVPNVGKSSLINKLTGRKSTQTGDKPGVTKGKQWVRLKGNLELLDTPGILWPKFEDQEVALNLAFSRAIKDEILDTETLALRLIEKLMKIEPEKLKARYKLDCLGETPIETMDMIGHKRGFITGKKELDYTRIATTVLNEFRDGKIGNITLEVPENVKR